MISTPVGWMVLRRVPARFTWRDSDSGTGFSTVHLDPSGEISVSLWCFDANESRLIPSLTAFGPYLAGCAQLVFTQAADALMISEVMYNPSGGDHGHE